MTTYVTGVTTKAGAENYQVHFQGCTYGENGGVATGEAFKVEVNAAELRGRANVIRWYFIQGAGGFILGVLAALVAAGFICAAVANPISLLIGVSIGVTLAAGLFLLGSYAADAELRKGFQALADCVVRAARGRRVFLYNDDVQRIVSCVPFFDLALKS